jgi:peptidoglycan/xylan/chitin deacetylase (PgdA/CDA1 family)
MNMKNSLYKQNIKRLLYFLIYYTGLLHLSIMILKKIKKEHSAAVLNYHRIVENNINGFLFKSDTIHHNVKLFKREISFINKWFNIISMDELIDRLAKKKNFDKPSMAITFDDGYRDNYTLAYPILKQYNLPATIYLISGLIGTTQKVWLDEVDFALLTTTEEKLEFPSLFGDEIVDLLSIQDKQKVNIKIGEKLKRVENKNKLRLIEELCDRLKVSRNSFSNNDRVMMNWEEVKEMNENKIAFGAHTHSHPILTQLPLKEAKNEISISKQIVEKELNTQVNHFAFPNGSSLDFDEELKQFCIDLGFRSIATGNYGINNTGSDPYHIRRIVPYVPFYVFAVEIVRIFWRG